MSIKQVKFLNYLKRNKVFRGLIALIYVSFFLEGVIQSEFLGFVKFKFGLIGEILSLIFLSLTVIFVAYIVFYFDEKRRTELKADPNSEPLKERYRGLIVSMSLIREPKEEIFRKIDSIKDIHDNDGLNKLYEVRGIGQTCRAIRHHLGELDACWLLCTKEAKEGEELIKYFTKRFSKKTVEIQSIELIDSSKIGDTFKQINEIYMKEIKNVDLREEEVIADLTGGTVITSCAMVLACVSIKRDMEYVIQNTYDLIKINENISEIVFDR
jgi:uncharacterized membrane protein